VWVGFESETILIVMIPIYSIIAAEGAIANVVGMTQMNPPIKDLREQTPKYAYIGLC